MATIVSVTVILVNIARQKSTNALAHHVLAQVFVLTKLHELQNFSEISDFKENNMETCVWNWGGDGISLSASGTVRMDQIPNVKEKF